MLISPDDLKAQYLRARKKWPFLDTISEQFGLPRFLIYAVGSRETNLNPVYTQGSTGDGGHGHGLFQLDDRWHDIPAGFDTDPKAQATAAAKMLRANLGHYDGHVFPACSAYNCGIGNADAGITYHGDPDYWTTHSGGVGYGAEVVARWQFLKQTYGDRPKPEELSDAQRRKAHDLRKSLNASDAPVKSGTGDRRRLRRLMRAIKRALSR